MVDRNPCPVSTREGRYTVPLKAEQARTEGGHPGPGEPGPVDGQKTTLVLQLPRLDRQLRTSNSNLKHQAHIKQTGPEDLGPKEEEPKGEKVVEVGVRWGVEVHSSLWGGVNARHTGSTIDASQEQRTVSDCSSAGLLGGRRFRVGPGLWLLRKALAVFCL